MRKSLKTAYILTVTLSFLSGCGGSKLEKALHKDMPEACLIKTNPPLIVPKDFYLPPPGEGKKTAPDKAVQKKALPKEEESFLKKTDGTERKPEVKTQKSEESFLERMN